MADWGYALGQGIGAGAKSASGIIDSQLKEEAELRAADRQLDYQQRLMAAQELMQERAREHAYQIQQRPVQAAGNYLRDAGGEVPMTANDVTELTGAGTGEGELLARGMRGNYEELRKRAELIPLADRADYLAQLDRQRAAEAQGKTKTRSREEQIAAGMEAALAAGDLQSYQALKAMVPEKFVPLNDNGLYNTATGEIIQPTTSKYDRQAELQERRFEQQLELQDRRMQASERAADERAARSESREQARAEAKALAKKLEPLPVGAQKQRSDELEAIATSSQIDRNLTKFIDLIDGGKLDFGPINNLANRTRNALGVSNKESQNFANFNAELEKLRNDSLRLNAGVQTDGDAQRAWNELINNINDKDVVLSRLKIIRDKSREALGIRKSRVDLIQENYGKPPIDFEPYINPGKPKDASAGVNPQIDSLVEKYRSKPNG